MFLGLEKLKEAVKSEDPKEPVKKFAAYMKELGIGIDTPVVCYDIFDGAFACDAACMLSERGVKAVTVYDGDFKVHHPRSETELTGGKTKANGKNFNFLM